MIKTGIDRLFEDPQVQLKDKRVGLLAHPASINNQGIHTLTILHQHPHVQLTQLFGPEHGLTGHAQDMEAVQSGIDPLTGLPVKSLYGNTVESLTPIASDLKNIDILICDLQDVGSRYYTYIYTIVFCMQACMKLGKQVIVLDRPNPINGVDLEGKILKKGFESFVGLTPIPVRHGMTIGELALYFNTEEQIHSDLHIVKMEGWKREMYFDETGLPWVKPSPNMKDLHTAIIYPGLCLLEATEVSEGRGTPHPFKWIGAPYMKGHELTKAMNTLLLPGIRFDQVSFTPTFQKWAQQECHGLQLTVTDRQSFKPVLTGVALLKTMMGLYPTDFQWRAKPYEFIKDIPALDLLSGDDQLRKDLENQKSLEDIQQGWNQGYKDFLGKRKKYLMY